MRPGVQEGVLPICLQISYFCAAGFDSMSLIEGSDSFAAVYLGNRTTTTESKKEDVQLTGK